MAWNWLDIVIVLLALAQIGLCISIVMILLKIKSGPIARLMAAVNKNVVTGKRLVDTGNDAGKKALPHLLNTKAELMRLPRFFRPIQLNDAPINYGSLAKNWATFNVARNSLKQATSLLGQRPDRNTVTTPPPGPARVPLAERMGLVPPAWRRISPYLRHIGTARQVIAEVRRHMQ